MALCLLATLALTAIDLWSKDWAASELSEARSDAPPVCEARPGERALTQRASTVVRELVPGHLELRYTENCGAAFSMLEGASPALRHGIFGGAALTASIVLFAMLWLGRGGRLFVWAVPLIVSGALGNLADRLRQGYVIDFIRYHWQTELPLLGHSWPTINIADVTIALGVALLIIDGYRVSAREKVGAGGEQAPLEVRPGSTRTGS